MTTYVALLRAVNLPGHNKVAMRDLCGMLADLGFAEPRSLLQSGNLVFRGAPSLTAKVERRLEEAAAERLGLSTEFFVRTAPEWRDLIAANPFPEAAERDPGHLLVLTLRDAPGEAAVSALQAAIRDREVVRAVGRQAYVVYPDGIGRSRLTYALIERELGTPGTGRNWNTVQKLAALAGPS